MQQILDGIYRWSRFSAADDLDLNGYLFCHPAGNTCVDPVEPQGDELKQLVALEMERIVITCAGHGRAANLLREHTGARITIHPDVIADVERDGIEIDDEITMIDVFGELEVIDLSGASAGEIALFWPERRVLMVGAALVGTPAGSLSLARRVNAPDRLHANLRRLLDLDFDALLPAEGTPVLTGAREQVLRVLETAGM